ncbi:hypothetical protein [Adhaeribacter rhizoryzae]|uniref:Uncharacterized protein n=1 Tax=Adhaeribacter rhizoryzae TaxID=2607907 RepID=A0A5M6D9M9_9BACT|nr:hypothetical protein [Adhaeribacter rhizoryzae]KAA5544083.1 hypothetical protein F0145_16040 [Adhaeribacter rhizoryzae]
MEASEKDETPAQVPLPEQFYSYATGKPFDTCVTCNTYLLGPGTQYMVEKAIIRYPNTNVTDVAFEYAMCLPCSEKMRQSLSKESLARIESYFMAHVDLAARQELLNRAGEAEPQEWFKTCLVKNTPIEEETEYQLIAHCNGTNLVVGLAPYMISGKAADELSELLSAQTKEVLDDFIDEHFGLPPELKALIKEKNLLLL